MLTLKIEIKGKTDSDLEIALDEVARSVARGNTSGADSNDTGRYSFAISGEAEETDEED